MMLGYFRDPAASAELIDKDGWLHTGDIGRIHANGNLQLVDRKRHIFKLPNGEFVAPERIENIYRLSPLINSCFVHGDSKHVCGHALEENISSSSSSSYSSSCDFSFLYPLISHFCYALKISLIRFSFIDFLIPISFETYPILS